MCSKGFFRRILPFFAAFAIGVFIASFFVTIGGQRWKGERGKRFHKMQQLRTENEELRNENLRLKNELDSQRWSHVPEVMGAPRFDVPPPPPMPVAPHAKR